MKKLFKRFVEKLEISIVSKERIFKRRSKSVIKETASFYRLVSLEKL